MVSEATIAMGALRGDFEGDRVLCINSLFTKLHRPWSKHMSAVTDVAVDGTSTRGKPSVESFDGIEVTTIGGSSVSEQAALDLRVARRMFYGGFAALPWLWFVAWVHFRKPARQPGADPQLKKYADRSLVGAICGGVALVAWIVAVQLSWHSWGDFGVSIMLVVPDDGDV
jgi:presenilin enhancer 2